MKNIYLHETPPVKSRVARIKAFGRLAGNASDESLGLGSAKYTYNFRIGGRALIPTDGVEVAKMNGTLLPSSVTVGGRIKKALIYKRRNRLTDQADDRLIYLMANGKLYEANFSDRQLRQIPVAQSDTMEIMNFGMNFKDVLLMFNIEGNVSYYDGNTVYSAPGPGITGACVYRQRVYGIEIGSENKLRWSAKQDPFVWNDASRGSGQVMFVDDGGALRRVVACGNYMYVFRDYAVYAFKGFPDSNYYTMTKIYSAQKPIYSASAAAWNDKLYFVSEDGIFCACGTEIKRMWQDEFLLLDDKSGTVGECFGATYYIASKLKTEGETVGDEENCRQNNGILGISVFGDGVDIIRGVDVAGFVPCYVEGNSCLFLMNNPNGPRDMNLGMFSRSGTIYGTPAVRKWRSPSVVLGRNGEDSVVRKVHILARTDMTLTVRTNEEERVFELKGSIKTQTVPMSLRGERLQIEVEADGPHFYLEGFEIEYETTERRLYGGN